MALDFFEGRSYNGVALTVALLALLVAVVTAYFARAAVFPPRRRLSVRLLKPARLLGSAGGEVGDLEVSRKGRVLEDPHIVTIIMRNTGRHAISSSQFDQDRPIRIDLGAPIEAILSAATGHSATCVAIDDQVILFGPELIRRKQEIQIQALTASAPQVHENVVAEHLVDTTVTIGTSSSTTTTNTEVRPASLFGSLSALVISVAALVSALQSLFR
ncbi:hypothetical protein ABZ671_04640 [Micromonospora sp. NPDC006766]|uniref:hypothetical protein n=1 Tax=Micromonospora sp. NPDC006766 TaxID=3154778 RepID=UPI0033D92A12